MENKICSRCVEAGIEEPQVLQTPEVRNALSRLDNKTYVCSICGVAEAYADFTGQPFVLIRQSLEQDRQEALRLPPGDFHGALYPFPTGGYHA